MLIYIQLSSRDSNSPNSNIRLIATNIIFSMSNSSSISKNFLLTKSNRRTKVVLLARYSC